MRKVVVWFMAKFEAVDLQFADVIKYNFLNKIFFKSTCEYPDLKLYTWGVVYGKQGYDLNQ